MTDKLQELLGISILILSIGIASGLFFHGWPTLIQINKRGKDK